MAASIGASTNGIGLNIAADVYDVGGALFVDWLLKQKEAGHNVCSVSGSYSFAQNEMEAEIGKVLPGAQILRTSGRDLIAIGEDVFLTIRDEFRTGAVWDINVFGDGLAVAKVKATMDKILSPFRSSTVHWWYMAAHGAQSTRTVLDTPRGVIPAMYPIKAFSGDPMGYMKRYYDSSASVLFLLGPPGTGKTSLIRQFLWENELSAFVAYDEKVLRADTMFMEFLSPNRESKEADVLVLEDVTELLTKREMDKNEMMARFLNVSDGLIQLPHKKIIFTTNLPSLKDVDPALLRPGRCYDVVEMRPLFYEEATDACKAAGLPIPLEKKDYLMSELYNQGGREAKPDRRVGII